MKFVKSMHHYGRRKNQIKWTNLRLCKMCNTMSVLSQSLQDALILKLIKIQSRILKTGW